MSQNRLKEAVQFCAVFLFAENGRLIEENHHYVAVRERVGLLYRRDDLTFWPAGSVPGSRLETFQRAGLSEVRKGRWRSVFFALAYAARRNL